MTDQILSLARGFHVLKLEAARLSEALKDVNSQWATCEAELLQAMADEGLASMKIDGIGTLSTRTENYLSVTGEQKHGFYDYLKHSGNGGLLKEEVNPATLKAFLKQHVEELTRQGVEAGKEEFDARTEAVTFLQAHGASVFTKRGITLRGASRG